MADVQVERGHIRIANKLYRAAVLAKLSPVEGRALMECLWRQYGWSKGGAPVPFSLGGSGLAQSIGGSRSTASQALTTLVDAGIIIPTGETDDRGRRSFLVCKDYERWTCGFHRNPGRVHWTPAVGEVSPYQNTSVPKSERLRSGFETPATPKAQPVEASSERLEPRRSKESQTPIVPKGTKSDPRVYEVWAHWRKRNPTARKEPSTGKRSQTTTIKARLADLSDSPDPVKALCAYFDWVRDSDHKRARLCRDDGYDSFESLMRPSHVSERMPWVREWVKRGKAQAPSERAEWSAWWAGEGEAHRSTFFALAMMGQRPKTTDAAVEYLTGKPGAPPAAWMAPRVERWLEVAR